MPTPALPFFEPSCIVAGDNVQWLRSFDDYSAASYTLKYALMPTTGSLIEITAETYTDGVTFWVNVGGTDTEAWAPGLYLWQASVTDSGGNRTTLFPGRMLIRPDFATADVANYLSTVKQTLDALYALVQGKASSDQMNYTIRGRSLSRMQPKELLDWIDFYEELYDREIRREAGQQGRANKGKIVVSFNDPSGFPVPVQWWRQGGGY